MKNRTADRSISRKSTQSRLATTVATTAVSLVILTAAQEQLDAKDPKGLTIRQNQPQNGRDAAIDKYFAQGYNYCDALVLAAFWGEKSALDAKYRLGQKMLDFGPEDGLLHIRNARGEALKKDPSDMPCWFTDGGYTFDDAELLGQLRDRQAGVLAQQRDEAEILTVHGDPLQENSIINDNIE